MNITLQRIIAFIGVVAVGVLGAVGLEGSGATKESHPPHSERREAVSPSQGDTLMLPEVRGWTETTDLVAKVLAEEEAQRAAEAAAAVQEAAQRATVAQPQRQESVPVQTVSVDGACDGIAWVLPVYIVYRESHCNFGAFNAGGCGGYGCVGAYQFDRRHWIPREEGGWGGCAWIGDWTIPENQHACAAQMSNNGTNLAPWGG